MLKRPLSLAERALVGETLAALRGALLSLAGEDLEGPRIRCASAIDHPPLMHALRMVRAAKTLAVEAFAFAIRTAEAALEET